MMPPYYIPGGAVALCTDAPCLRLPPAVAAMGPNSKSHPQDRLPRAGPGVHTAASAAYVAPFDPFRRRERIYGLLNLPKSYCAGWQR